MSARSSSSSALAASALVLAALLLAIAFWVRNAAYLHDDALISLRYARHFVDGEGLVWNRGERVEGYTNFLHLGLTAGLGALGLDLVTAVRTLNVAAWLGMLVALYAGFRAFARAGAAPEVGAAAADGPVGRAGLAAAVPLALAATAPTLLLWVWGGLEGPLLACFVALGLGACLVALRSASGLGPALVAGTAFGLATLTRPDAGLFAAVACAVLLARGLVPALVAGAATALPIGLHLAWRVAYYGEFLPNTYYAKSSGLPAAAREHGWAYLRVALETVPLLALGAAAGLWVLGVRGSPRTGAGGPRLAAGYLLLSLAAYALWLVRIGGDHMPAARLAAPLVPVAAWLVHLYLVGLGTRGARIAPVLLAVVAIALPLRDWAREPEGGIPRDAAAFVGAIVGEHIASAWPAGSLVALHTAGSTPYFADAHTYIDMLGLNDPVIARRELTELRLPLQRLPGHAKGDGAYVLERDPDYVILGPAHGRPAESPRFLSDLELGETRSFYERYVKREAWIACGDRAGFERYTNTASGRLLLTYYARRPAVND